MFLKPSVLNNLMKKAYKGGLRVGRTENDWIYLAGGYWETIIKREFIPKKTLGDIITLVGELPEKGECFLATKEGNQIECGVTLDVDDDEFKEATLTVTKLLLISHEGVVQRLLQDENTGRIYIVNNVFMSIVDNGLIEESKGEYGVFEPFYHPAHGILWKNNVCKFRAHFRIDEKNGKTLKELKSVDITPDIPQK